MPMSGARQSSEPVRLRKLSGSSRHCALTQAANWEEEWEEEDWGASSRRGREGRSTRKGASKERPRKKLSSRRGKPRGEQGEDLTRPATERAAGAKVLGTSKCAIEAGILIEDFLGHTMETADHQQTGMSELVAAIWAANHSRKWKKRPGQIDPPPQADYVEGILEWENAAVITVGVGSAGRNGRRRNLLLDKTEANNGGVSSMCITWHPENAASGRSEIFQKFGMGWDHGEELEAGHSMDASGGGGRKGAGLPLSCQTILLFVRSNKLEPYLFLGRLNNLSFEQRGGSRSVPTLCWHLQDYERLRHMSNFTDMLAASEIGF
ncbi:hypothetical protein CYMTET_54904 [Cymbomonas tetramitiformis]|uniref:Uncharacterized protein n=1 Tax=Cymbomonas tetramitiformis TaxID=36881 RepID=A0AAE0EP40_9CHLO|nr:hypothetical protein CYMTET_54904 [Cymbomonas tetramitiformis]